MTLNELWVQNGTIVTSERSFLGDLYIQNGRIRAIVERGMDTRPLPSASASVIDAKGKHVLPGLVDVHVHFRDPGSTHKEAFLTGSAAAACGGVTTVLDMPNTDPPVATPDVLLRKAERASGQFYVDYGFYGVIDEHNLEALLPMAEAGAVAYKLFLGPTTGDIQAPGWGRLMRVFREVSRSGLPVTVHAEDRDVIEYWQARAPKSADDYRAFLATRPRFGELAATETVCLLAGECQTPIHVAHVCLAEAVSIIASSKEQGAPVTAETCPHYLTLTEADCERLGPVSKILPPIRGQDDQDRLWRGLRDGAIDLISTDHAPHQLTEKEGESWLNAPGGAIGTETMLPVLLGEFHRGRLSLVDLVYWTSRRPAEVFGLAPHKGDIRVGADADLVIIDLDREWEVSPEALHSKSKNSPFLNSRFKGWVHKTLLRGRVIAEDQQLLGSASGQMLTGLGK